jgi:hypothetical protein
MAPKEQQEMKVPKVENALNPYLKAETIGKLGTSAKILFVGKAQEAESEFSDMTADVKYKGKTYALGIKYNSPNLARLIEIFGSENTDRWKGPATVVVSKNKKFKNLYLQVQ